MNTRRTAMIVTLIATALCVALGGLNAAEKGTDASSRPLVYQLTVDGSINPAVNDYIAKGIEKAEEANATCVIITIDTPGGMITTTKTIIKEMLNAKLPVVVYVYPSGSSATSAGALITMGGDIAAMAPGTNIGAAHPVNGGGEDIGKTMEEKVMNDLTAYMRSVVAKRGRNVEWAQKAITASVSITAQEALKMNVINVVADSIPNLLTQLDGKSIEKNGKTMVFHTASAHVEKFTAGYRFKVLDLIADPNIVYILGMLAMMGIMMEFYNPGMIFPGVLGGLCLLLTLFAAQVLPINYTGILLIVLAVVLFILELKVPSFGLLSIGAIVSLLLGSVMLFESGETAMRVSWAVIIPTVVLVSAFFIFAMGLAVRAWRSQPRTGGQGLIGEIGLALTDLDTEGKVSVHGEYWNARADSRIPKGERVRVIRVENLFLKVTRDAGT